jgi:hypothetical protein
MNTKLFDFNLNKWVWLLAISPILLISLQLLIYGLVTIRFEYLYFILAIGTLAIVYRDFNCLKKEGVAVEKFGSPASIPTYLYKRSLYFDHCTLYLILWIILIIFVIFLPTSMIISIPQKIYQNFLTNL